MTYFLGISVWIPIPRARASRTLWLPRGEGSLGLQSKPWPLLSLACHRVLVSSPNSSSPTATGLRWSEQRGIKWISILACKRFINLDNSSMLLRIFRWGSFFCLFLKKNNTTVLNRIFEREVVGSDFQKRAGGYVWEENLPWEVPDAGTTWPCMDSQHFILGGSRGLCAARAISGLAGLGAPKVPDPPSLPCEEPQLLNRVLACPWWYIKPLWFFLPA